MTRRKIALAAGVACHTTFGLAVGAMAYMLYFGFGRSLAPIGGLVGRAINWVLLLQFPLLHSFFLAKPGRRILTGVFPKNLGRELISTSFVTVAGLQLLLVFMLWTPEESIWFAPSGALNMFWSALYLLSWIFLIKALYDSGIALQSGFLGWSAVYRGTTPVYPALPEGGTYRYCRQPIYLAFFLILVSAPVWSYDHLLFLLIWGSYCLVGPILKERRLTAFYGERYREYQRRVPYMLPKLHRFR